MVPTESSFNNYNFLTEFRFTGYCPLLPTKFFCFIRRYSFSLFRLSLFFQRFTINKLTVMYYFICFEIFRVILYSLIMKLIVADSFLSERALCIALCILTNIKFNSIHYVLNLFFFIWLIVCFDFGECTFLIIAIKRGNFDFVAKPDLKIRSSKLFFLFGWDIESFCGQ